MLIGKGVWAAYGNEIELAIRMAQATVILMTLEGEWNLADIRAIPYPGG